ncbi:MAG TPA: nuclear transport factor 2 family protein [Spirochaetota bacterium]|mgnify:CR=1 FL=1|nr:nuclear transport factor 2 family protein [Spirochaetota bacterium]HPG49323.1 nuclear transport factor 2 family protein [Spirochaetota bacterium]HPN10701.1 nuclear transport factor 2 family protein [Spirochaetota bacterium]HQL81202.1 nuclear transport factor 2 family protein [Spirochaetota bacterium]
MRIEDEIIEIVNRETRAWDTRDVDLFLSIFHPDMVWPWPPANTDHDPVKWELFLGKFDHDRWKGVYTKFFEDHRLVHNKRNIVSIIVSEQRDGAFAVVDIDTLWEHVATGVKNHWLGRVCKVYAKVRGEWKMTMHTGVLKY